MFALAFLIISTIVGAGFATGAELLAFFGGSALPPFVIAFLAGVFLFIITSILLFIQYKLQSKKNKATQIENLAPSFFMPIYFIFFVAMIAGISQIAGSAVAAVAVILAILIVCFGFDRMLFINKFITVFALIVLLVVSLSNLRGSAVTAENTRSATQTIIWAVLYAGMNCCMLEALFAQALKRFKVSEVLLSCLFASCIITFFITVILTALNNNGAKGALPILELDNGIVTHLAIFICVLTSMFVALFNLSQRPQNKKNGKHSLFFLLTISAVSYGCSFLGFFNIISVFYPLIGVVIIIYIIYQLIKIKLNKDIGS